MAQSSFNPGDVVRLKSLGPVMTVANIAPMPDGSGYMAECIWFDGKEIKTYSFPMWVLEPTSPKKNIQG